MRGGGQTRMDAQAHVEQHLGKADALPDPTPLLATLHATDSARDADPPVNVLDFQIGQRSVDFETIGDCAAGLRHGSLARCERCGASASLVRPVLVEMEGALPDGGLRTVGWWGPC